VYVHSFAPISDASSRVLILGSMPGRASLRAGKYYAHPQNLFWKVMGGFLDLDPSAPYDERVSRLRRHGIALWDVLKSCTRASSLDSDIDDSSIVVNEFAEFLPAHAGIRTICFNGAKAETVYRKHVLPGLLKASDLTYHRLPSTSPANASIPAAKKLATWQAALHSASGAGTNAGRAS
jgi:TDG/mug DNA glycosylase family protein